MQAFVVAGIYRQLIGVLAGDFGGFLSPEVAAHPFAA